MRHRVYESARGMDSFEPWLWRIETEMTEAVIDEALSEIPPEWYVFDQETLGKMLEQFLRQGSLRQKRGSSLKSFRYGRAKVPQRGRI